MNAVSTRGIKQDILTMSITQTKDMTHHTHNRWSTAVCQTAHVPVKKQKPQDEAGSDLWSPRGRRRGGGGGGGVMAPGVPCVLSGNWGQECDSLLYRVIALREQRNKQIAVLWSKFWNESRLICSSHIQRCWSFSGRESLRIILFESLSNKQSSCSFLLENKWTIHEFKLRKHWPKICWLLI